MGLKNKYGMFLIENYFLKKNKVEFVYILQFSNIVGISDFIGHTEVCNTILLYM